LSLREQYTEREDLPPVGLIISRTKHITTVLIIHIRLVAREYLSEHSIPIIHLAAARAVIRSVAVWRCDLQRGQTDPRPAQNDGILTTAEREATRSDAESTPNSSIQSGTRCNNRPHGDYSWCLRWRSVWRRSRSAYLRLRARASQACNRGGGHAARDL